MKRPSWLRALPASVPLLALVLAAPAARAGVANAPKVYVFPYQGVFKGVPKEVITQVTDLVRNEVKNNDEVQLQKGPVFIPEAVATEVKPMSDKDLKDAEKLYAAGEAAYQELELDKAIAAFKGAVDKYESSLAMIQNFDPVVDTLLMLAVCYYRRDKEDDGAKMLVKVIRLRPELVLDPEKYPPMFRNTVETIRTQLLRRTRGEAEVIANAEGATVFLDGRKVGTAPLLLKDLVPGEHYVRVEKEGLQTWADKVVVEATKKRAVLASLGGVMKASGPLGEIAEALRANRIDAAAAAAIASQGKEISADLVLLGGVAKVGDNYRVGSFLLRVDNHQVCQLAEIQLDPDLLGASVEVYNLVSAAIKTVDGCPSPAKLPIPVVTTAAEKKVEIKAVAVGPAVPPPEAAKPKAALPPPEPEPGPAVAQPEPVAPVPGPAVPGRGPAVPGPAVPGPAVAQPVEPAPGPDKPAVTDEGLAVGGGSAIVEPTGPVVPMVPVAGTAKPLDEEPDEGPRWYASWWFWTLVGAVVVGGAVVGAGAGTNWFEGSTNGGTVTVGW